MESRFAPYAPPSAVLKVIRHYRDRDVPERVTNTNLLQLGVSEALVPRTMQALKFLQLLEDDGITTERFRAIRFAKDDEYQEVFARVLDEAYKDIFDHVEVGTATDTQIANAFRPYSPGGQRSRMVTLFLALCQEAGLHVAVPPRVGTPRKKAEGRKPPTSGKAERSKDGPKVNTSFARTSDDLLFGVTDDDVAALTDDEFASVWDALGKVARARARRKATPDREAERGD